MSAKTLKPLKTVQHIKIGGLLAVTFFALLLLSVGFVSAYESETFDVDALESVSSGFTYSEMVENYTVTMNVGNIENITDLSSGGTFKTTFVNTGGDGFCFYVTFKTNGWKNVTVHPVASDTPNEGTTFTTFETQHLELVSATCDGSTWRIYRELTCVYSDGSNLYQNLTRSNVAVSVSNNTIFTGTFSVLINNVSGRVSSNYLYASIGAIVTIAVVVALVKKVG